MHTEMILVRSRVEGRLPQTENVGRLQLGFQWLEALGGRSESDGLLGAGRFPSSSTLRTTGKQKEVKIKCNGLKPNQHK